MSAAGPPLRPDQVFVPPGIHPVYPLNVATVAGPQLLAPWFSAFLFGIFLVQAFSYYEAVHHGRKDHWLDVTLVVATAVGSTVTAGLEIGELWRVMMTGYGDLNFVIHHTRLSAATIFVQTFINFFYMTFFASKAWRINERSLLIGGVLAVAVLFSLATNLAKASTIAIHVEDDKDLKRLLNPVQWSAHLGSALTDILISALLTIRLLRLSAGGFGFAHSTDTIVRRIIAYSMSSAVLTAGAAVALLVCAAQSGQAFWIMNQRQVLHDRFGPQPASSDAKWPSPRSASYSHRATAASEHWSRPGELELRPPPVHGAFPDEQHIAFSSASTLREKEPAAMTV